MWEDFQKVLEKRVNRKKTVIDDKYLIIEISQKELVKFFGEVSREYIKIKDYKFKKLFIMFENSIWRSEFKINEKKIIQEINNSLGGKLIEKIILI